MTSPTVPIDLRRAVAALMLLSFSTFVFVIAESLPIGLLTLIGPSLHVSYARVGLLVTGYGAVVALTSVPLTRLTMQLSRRRLLCGCWPIQVAAGTPRTKPSELPVNKAATTRPCPLRVNNPVAVVATTDQNTAWLRAATTRAPRRTP